MNVATPPTIAGARPSVWLVIRKRSLGDLRGRLLAGLRPDARFVSLASRNHVLLEDEPAWRVWFDEVNAFLPGARAEAAAFPNLTPRERDIVEWIARGSDNAQVAAQLALSEKTVRNHITSIFAKLEVENRSQAIVLARDAGFGKKSP